MTTLQSLSGTGSLRIGAAFLSKFMPGRTVYLSNPTWRAAPPPRAAPAPVRVGAARAGRRARGGACAVLRAAWEGGGRLLMLPPASGSAPCGGMRGAPAACPRHEQHARGEPPA